MSDPLPHPEAPEMQRVTILDIAREVGVSKSTVSRALTDHPRISKETKAKIVQMAETLGYRPDPAMQILCSYRNSRRSKDSIREFPIAIVTDFTEPVVGTYLPSLIRDIEQCARSIGYIISTINALDYPRPESVGRVLKSRGVRGIICLAIFQEEFARDFPWQDFSVVLHGQPKVRPPCHMVREDRFDRMVKALRRVWELGYRRPAFAMVSQMRQSRYFDLMSGAYYSEIARLTGQPVLIPPHQIKLEHTHETIREWVETARPDAIVAENDGVYWRLRRAGFEIPRDFAYASLFRHPDHPELAGFNMECGAIAQAMVRQLDLLIRHNVLGFPENVNTILVKKPFEDGASLPPAKKAKSRQRKTRDAKKETMQP